MPRKNKEEEKFPYITGPSRLRDSSPGIRLVSHVSHRDILWKTGDLVSVIEEEVRYFAQVCSIFIVKDCDWSIQTMRAKYFEPWIWWVRLDPCDCAVPSESSGMFGSVAPSRRRRQVASGSDEEMPIDLACLTPEGSPPEYLEKLEDVPFNDSQWSQLRVDAQRWHLYCHFRLNQ